MRLKKECGKDNGVLEENDVDIKVKLEKEIDFYGVKPSAFASDCIAEYLGHISYRSKKTMMIK